MTFFEFVSVVQKHFKNCEIRGGKFSIFPAVEIKREYYQRFVQVASINGRSVESLQVENCITIGSFVLDGVKFVCLES